MASDNSRTINPRPPTSVIMVIQTFYPFIGGAEKQCLQLCKSLQSKGLQVKVFTEHWKGLSSYEDIEGIPVKRLGRGGPRLFHSLFFMVAIAFYLWARRKTYDVIHVHLAASHAVAASLMGKLLKKKVIVKIGGGTAVGEIALSRKTFFGKLKLWSLGILKPQLVILNEDQKKELRGFGLEKIPVVLIANGVDTDIYRRCSQEEKSSLRKKLGWSGLVFLFTGRFSPDKISLDIFTSFLQAWKSVRQIHSDIFFYLVGQGPLKKDYESLIQHHQLQDSVFLWDARDQVAELYQAADVFVLPSQVEGLSNSLLEAMASGLPVLASRVPGITDLIQENIHGLLFDPFSPVEIKESLKKFYSGPGLLKEWEMQSRKPAAIYSIETTVKKYLALYG